MTAQNDSPSGSLFADRLDGAGELLREFAEHLGRVERALSATSDQSAKLSTTLSGALRSALDGVMFDGMRGSEALSLVARRLSGHAYEQAITPVTGQLGALVAGAVSAVFPNSGGAGFLQQRVAPLASGGAVDRSARFGSRREAASFVAPGVDPVMPSRPRGSVGPELQAAPGGQAVNVVMNIRTPDVEGFQRSRNQIAAEISRALARGQRNR